MKLSGTAEDLFIAQDIFTNKKRFAKLNTLWPVYRKFIDQAIKFAVAECAKRKIKVDEEDIRNIAWKVYDYFLEYKHCERA